MHVDRLEWWRAIDADPRVVGTTHHVAMVLSRFGSSRISPSMETLLDATGYKKRAILRHRAALVDLGYLVQLQRGQTNSTAAFALALPALVFGSQGAPTDTLSTSLEGARTDTQSGDWVHRETRLGAPGDTTGCTPVHPYQQAPEETSTTTTAREEAKVLVQPEDHNPHSDESLADRLRGAGASWTDYEIKDAVTRLVRAFGDDAAAMTPAVAVLMSLATRRKPVERVGAYLASLNDDQLRALRPTSRPRRTTSAPAGRPTWCGACHEASRRREDPDNGRDLGRCPQCHPDFAKASAA